MAAQRPSGSVLSLIHICIIDQVLHSVIIPLLPLYVCGTFIDMTKSGKTFAILGSLWKVFLAVSYTHLKPRSWNNDGFWFEIIGAA